MLSREKTGLMPSYMDKNINTRASIDQLNLKTLEMNCSDIRKPILKTKKQKKWECLCRNPPNRINKILVIILYIEKLSPIYYTFILI